MGFKPLSYLEDAVKSKNIKDIRRSLRSYIQKCLGDIQEINEALEYIKSSLSEDEYRDIWEEYDGVKLDQDKQNWNENYFASVGVDLTDNFSKERFEHILKVGKYVYGSTKLNTKSNKKQTVSNAKTKSEDKNKQNKNFLPLVIVGGLIILGIPLLIKLIKK